MRNIAWPTLACYRREPMRSPKLFAAVLLVIIAISFSVCSGFGLAPTNPSPSTPMQGRALVTSEPRFLENRGSRSVERLQTQPRRNGEASRALSSSAGAPKLPTPRTGHQIGEASWFSGEVGACGRRLVGLYAAHRSLPCGTEVTVAARGGRSVIVTILDRGPYLAGRVIDLSPAAFSRLAPLSAGVCDVVISW